MTKQFFFFFFLASQSNVAHDRKTSFIQHSFLEMILKDGSLSIGLSLNNNAIMKLKFVSNQMILNLKVYLLT